MHNIDQLLMAISICVVMPVWIVWIVFKHKTNETKERTNLIMKALEKDAEADIEKFLKLLGSAKSTEEKVIGKLFNGCASTTVGIGAIAIAVLHYFEFEGMNDSTMILGTAGIFALAYGIASLCSYYTGKKLLLNKEQEIVEG
ncbi:DUF6249 domain-containing protein [Prevotella sp. HUN102]|uniref:DUF6249 domain-containing protein n=1 Tax=Prevotella sp. HUN102 TaxID=1392486 RepID=UPI000AB8B0EF|nr:DUF6249 domain-containing protein [Prevotella sp. HUN102]